jgi:putative hemolysin
MKNFESTNFHLSPSFKNHTEPGLEVFLAQTAQDVLAAQRLRYRVFTEEFGASLPKGGVDRDRFDAYCEHLLVRDTVTQEVVGTYRILSPKRALAAGAWYSENEFVIDRLHHLRDQIVEVGRSCVDADYRTGAVIMLLWSGLAAYLKQSGYRYLMGCASVGMSDGGHSAASLFAKLKKNHLVSEDLHVIPKNRLPIEHLNSSVLADPPPLFKGYLRLGAKVCGEPAWDPEFNTADFVILLDLENVTPRYARHFGI